MKKKQRQPRVANVVFATPCQYSVNANYFLSMLFMFLTSMQWNKAKSKREHPYDYIDGTVVVRQGSMIAQMRNELVDRALEMDGATHVLFVDSDMSFPAETLVGLLRHDVDVVALNCPTKQLPVSPTVRMKTEDGTVVPVYQRDALGFNNPLQKVWRVGTGIMLVKIDVFKKLKRPWFFFSYDEKAGKDVGEDWGFCQLCEENGIPVHVDFEYSQQVGHVGDLIYTHEMDGRDG